MTETAPVESKSVLSVLKYYRLRNKSKCRFVSKKSKANNLKTKIYS